MADGSTIEWTDATWQVVTGCSVVSPGCTNCYAMRLAGTRLRHHPSRAGLTQETKAGPVWNGLVRFNVGWLRQPLRWKKPRDIFVAAHGDLFHDAVQRWMLARIFAVMAMAHWHRFQILTKRPENMRAFVAHPDARAEVQEAMRDLGAQFMAIPWPLPNVWLGVSVEDQSRADERIPDLLATPAAVRFLSCEPLLSALDLRLYLEGREDHGIDVSRDVGSRVGACVGWTPSLDWIIVGSESGPRARPCDLDWVRSIRDQCVTADVPLFWKQHAINGKKISTPELDGKRWLGLPS